ncbi:rod-binding protein [Oceanibaculum indicum]|uniref:Rod binding protein n=1 Tax=Oceanibaculum indicum TaxID=526216 RepID=A0A420WNU6_9PROT|nr:rod-binding protein [Oceanibaculum indicum]RKQ72683.1 rod binding protein [Oceanibaculum indicum]
MSTVSSSPIDLSLATSQATSGRPTIPTGPGLTVDKARKAAEEFEAVFISEMLKPMFESLPTDGPFGGGPSEGIWRSLLVTEMGKEISRRGGFGIADNVQAEMLRLQETGK